MKWFNNEDDTARLPLRRYCRSKDDIACGPKVSIICRPHVQKLVPCWISLIEVVEMLAPTSVFLPFVTLLSQEEEHIDKLETQLGLIEKIGPESYLSSPSNPAQLRAESSVSNWRI